MEEGKRIFLVFLLGVSLCVVGGLVFLLIKVRRSRLLREEKDKDKSKQIQQVRLFGYSFKNQLGGGERYHHIARFLQIWSMLSLLSALGWLVMGISLYDKRVLDEASAISLVLTGWIYVYFLYSVVNFVRPLVDVAVNSYGNEELNKQNTEYLRQLVEIEKFKLKRSGQNPSE